MIKKISYFVLVLLVICFSGSIAVQAGPPAPQGNTVQDGITNPGVSVVDSNTGGQSNGNADTAGTVNRSSQSIDPKHDYPLATTTKPDDTEVVVELNYGPGQLKIEKVTGDHGESYFARIYVPDRKEPLEQFRIKENYRVETVRDLWITATYVHAETVDGQSIRFTAYSDRDGKSLQGRYAKSDTVYSDIFEDKIKRETEYELVKTADGHYINQFQLQSWKSADGNVIQSLNPLYDRNGKVIGSEITHRYNYSSVLNIKTVFATNLQPKKITVTLRDNSGGLVFEGRVTKLDTFREPSGMVNRLKMTAPNGRVFLVKITKDGLQIEVKPKPKPIRPYVKPNPRGREKMILL